METTDEARRALLSLFPEKTLVPNTEEYNSYLTSYFVAQENEINPACIICPTSSEDVSLTLKTISKVDIKFAIRGGGHNLNGGFANIENGVVISLRALKSVTIAEDKSSVTIEGGAKWGEVYPHLDALGIATSGGRVAGVGVGGLSTGGGISYFSGREGLVCDNIIAYEVVLPNGEIVNATSTSYPDLWKALKGGSSNFGIVTKVTIRCFPQGPFYGGCVVTPFENLPSQLDGFMNLMNNFDPYAAIIMSLSWNKERGSFSIFSNLEYTKDVEKPEILQQFTDVQPQYMNTMRSSTLSENLCTFANEAGKFVKNGLRNQFATTTLKSNRHALENVISLWKSSVSSVSHVQSINWAMSIQPFPVAYSLKTDSLGGNVLGLSPTDGPMILILVSYNYANKEDDEVVTTAAQKLISDIDEATKLKGCWSKFKYLNYAASWQDPIAGYGTENVAFLQDVARKYDPEGIFQTKCPGGFKVFK